MTLLPCRIGQMDRCEKQGYCSWARIFETVACKHIEKKPLSFDQIYDLSKDQKTFPLPKKKKKGLGLTEKKPTPYVPSRKRVLFDQADGLCYLCETKIELFLHATIDHVVPKSRGGTTNIENCRIAHGACNHKKGNLLISELRLPFPPPDPDYFKKSS